MRRMIGVRGIAVGTIAVAAFLGTASAGGGASTPGVVRGVVDRGEHDAPEPGRVVMLLAGDAPRRTATTDAWGRFAFDGVAPGVACEVRVDAADAAPVRAPLLALLPGETRDVGELWLGSAGAFDAFVADETGAPIVGATVDAFREAGGPLGEDVIERTRLDVARAPAAVATTDAKGHATFDVARGAKWTLAARAPGRSRVAWARLRASRDGASDVAFQLAKAERLTGRVVDAAGRPVPSAVVLARRSIASWGTCGTCSPLEEGAALWQSAVADAEGRYAFDLLPPGRINLLAAPPGGAPAYAGAVQFPDALELDVALPATGAILGRFTDETTGAPVAGVVVCAKGGAVDTACMAVTDATGAYVLDGVPAGSRVDMDARSPEGWVGAHWSDSPYERVLRVGQTSTLDATLQRAAAVTGRVTCDGVPLAGASVSVATLPEQGDNLHGRVVDGTSDAEGVFRVDGVRPGTIAVFACAAGDDQRRAWDVFYKTVVQDPAGRDREGVAVAAGAAVRRDVAIGRTPPDPEKSRVAAAMEEVRESDAAKVRVKLRVSTADGLPLVDAKYAVGDGEEDARESLGRWWTRVPPGGILDQIVTTSRTGHTRYVAAADDRHGVATTEIVFAADAKEASAEIVLPARPTMRGRVVADGRPVAGAAISVGGAAIARTSDDGTFAASWSSKCEFGVQARGFVRREFKGAQAAEDGVVELELMPAGVIAGRVVDAVGKPVAGVSVTPLDRRGEVLEPYRDWRASPPPAIPTTDADGRFALDELPRGEWRLRMEAPRAVATMTTAPIAVGTRDARIEVRPERRVAGRVVGPNGKPALDARVFCRPGPAGEEKTTTRTDDRGRFEFRGLGDGDVWLYVEPAWRSEMTPARRRVAAGGEDVEFALVAASEISGFVVTKDGAPFERCVVEATRVDEPKDDEAPWSGDLYRWTETKDGKCSFRILVPPNAKWRVEMSRRSDAHAVLKGGEDVASGTKDLALVADEGLTIEGVAVDEDGKPVERADVETWLGPGDPRRMRTQADGLFKLTALPPGAFLCVVVQQEDRVPVRAFGVKAGRTDLRVVLRPGLTITGRLLDANGRPETQHWVRALSAKWAAADLWRARPEKDGTFVIRGLEEGEWMLESFIPGCMRVDDVVDQGKAKAGATGVELKVPAK